MRRWAVWLALVTFAPASHAAEPQLTIDLPDVELALPRVSPPYFQKEGLPYQAENELVTELLMLIGNGELEAALARAREDYGEELALLEAGDPDGVVRGRASSGRLPMPVPAGGTGISATVLFLVGSSYVSLERYLPAEAALKAALAPLPDYLRVHEALAVLYLQTERYEEARVHLNRAAELGLNTATLHTALGYINGRAKNWWGAVSAYEQALAIEGDNRNTQTGLLQALNETQQYASGLALVEQMLREDADDPDLWLYRAHMALNSDRRDVTLQSLETAIRLGDESAGNKQVAATLHMERGSLARAVELLKSANADELEFPFLDQAVAWLVNEDEWDYARELLAAVDLRTPSLTDAQRSLALTRRASLQLHDGNREAGMTLLQGAVQLDASNAEALMILGEAYRDARDYTRAELTFQRASAFAAYRDNALVSLAQLAIDQQDYTRALTLLRDVVSRNPARTDLRRNVDVLENLVLAEAGNSTPP
jgi:tetratricopeptide (TPR) repeat protein